MLLSKQNVQTIFILVVLFPTYRDELSYIIFSKVFVTLIF